MDEKKSFRLVQPQNYDIMKLSDDMFEKASDQEKQDVVEERKSVSYWQDARRRFRANKVAMVALFAFCIILVFSFLGPLFIPYSYESQYRNNSKLKPLEYSEDELQAKKVIGQYGKIYSTELLPGSVKSIKKGNYYIKVNGETYGFTLTRNLRQSMIVYAEGEDPVLQVGIIKNLNEDGTFSELKPLEITDTVADDAREIKLVSRICPHFFGTDSSGRDLMARCMYGARVSLIIGIVAALIVLVIGSIIGAVAGIFGGVVDFIIMRIIDLIISIPSTLMVLLLQVVLSDPLQAWFDSSHSSFAKAMSSLGVGIVSIFIVFALLYWVSMARLVRGQVLQLKKMEFIAAEQVLGAKKGRIIRRHLLPNCVGQLVVATCLQVPSAIFTESFLSYLGIGVAAPMASLGSMCSDALSSLSTAPYMLLFPSIILSLLVLTLNLIGDGLRDALDPRTK